MQKDPIIPILVFFGATATGKTDITSEIFSSKSLKKLFIGSNTSKMSGCAEIVSSDSVQVYRYLKIGSASPSEDLLQELPHHLVNEKELSQEFSAADFVHEADKICADIYSRQKLPVLLGGTAFFMKNFMYGLPITPKADMKIRSFFQKRIREEGAAVLLEELKKYDPYTAKKLHINDEYRILRACEVYAASGKPLSSFALSEKYRPCYDFFIVSIDRPRNILYKRIENRVDKMIEHGLYEEILFLIRKGFTVETPALKAIGYREFFDDKGIFKGIDRLPEISDLIKRNTKHYAKRQETFFKKIPNVRHYNVENKDEIFRLYKEIYLFYKKYFICAEN